MPTNQTSQSLARIEEPETLFDTVEESWEVTDEFEAFSRQFTLTTRSLLSASVGDQIQIAAGYDTNRIRIMDGRIDHITQTTTPDAVEYQMVGRDSGASGFQTFRIFNVWKSNPTTDMPLAHDIIRDVAQFMGITLGTIEFPNYYLYNTYISYGKRAIDIIAELAEPWNLFAGVQYILQVRDNTLNVVKIDWKNPPAGGATIPRSQHAQQVLTQQAYLEQPRLDQVQFIIIRGAAYLQDICSLGFQVRTEYFRNVVTTEVQQSIAGQILGPNDTVTTTTDSRLAKDVVTETSVIEQLHCDKVLNRTETVYIDDVLTSRTTERYWYYEPGTTVELLPADVDTFQVQSGSPSDNALLYIVHTKREGFIDRGGVTVFAECFRETTQYYYDKDKQVACEQTTTQEFDETAGAWGITKHASRIHSQSSGGSVRTGRLSFIFEDSKFKVSSADVQHVGGTRPSINQPSSRHNVRTVQAQSPQGELDAHGNPIDPGQGLFTWTYENEYIGQDVCDRIYQQALDEQSFQLTSPHWETVNFTGILNPDLNVGRPVSLERADGTFADYVVESLTHSFGANQATTSGVGKRLTSAVLNAVPTTDDTPIRIRQSVQARAFIQHPPTQTVQAKASIIADVGGFTWEFDASALGGLNDGDKISSFPDTSGNSHNLSQATGSHQWTYKTNIQNGLAVARATAADQFMSMSGFSQARQSRTFFWVVSGTVPQTGDAPLISAASGGGGFDQEFDAGAGGLGYFNSGDTYEPGSPGVSGWQVITFRFDSSDNTGKVYRNGTLILTGGFHTGSETDTTWTIGSYGAGLDSFVGDYGQMRMYSSALSPTDLNTVVSLLKAKWGIA